MAKSQRLHDYETIMPLARRPVLNFSHGPGSDVKDSAEERLSQDLAPQAVKDDKLAAAFEQAEASRRERMKIEEQLRAANEQLDQRIQERTSELTRANERLQREIEKRMQTEEMLRKLSARILTLQDEERRRLGRELHDSAGQMLAALHINLGVIAQRTQHDRVLAAKVADTAALADQVICEIRTLSYLLHPPMLDEAGLASAVEWYGRGFSERSKIAVKITIDPDLPRFPMEVETAIFRIIQESLVNIHRHSGSRTACIVLRANATGAALSIRDEGCGIPPETLKNFEEGAANIGVGIGGMRERARQLGGSIDIRSANPGTLLEVRIPALKSAALAGIKREAAS